MKEAVRVTDVTLLSNADGEGRGFYSTLQDLHLTLNRSLNTSEQQALSHVAGDHATRIKMDFADGYSEGAALVYVAVPYDEVAETYFEVKEMLKALPSAHDKLMEEARRVGGLLDEQKDRIKFDIEQSKDIG